MWGRRETPGGVPERIVNRVRKLPTADLIDWSDQALYSTGRCLTTFQRERGEEFLDEALTGAQVLLAIVDEIRRRELPR